MGVVGQREEAGIREIEVVNEINTWNSISPSENNRSQGRWR